MSGQCGETAKALEHRHALLPEHVALGEQRLERQHHTIADEAAYLLAQDPEGMSDRMVLRPR